MKTLLLLIFLFLLNASNAQSWQWGKRGGGDAALTDANWTERVKSIKTDLEGNVYILCPVSTPNLNIDGNPKTAYSNGGDNDYALASFSCDGIYRWSKVIGGISSDNADGINIDSEGNVYLSGRIIPAYTGQNPVHFDDDVVLPLSPFNTNTFKKGLFLIKYNKDGILQWLKMPQPDDVAITQTFQTLTYGFCGDGNGNSWWLTRLKAGLYADGAYNVATNDTYHILKYDSAGNFTGGIPISIAGNGNTIDDLKMAVNPNTGTIYFAGYLITSSSGAISFNGEAVTHDLYLVAYDKNGNFLWKKESTQNFSRGVGFTDIFINDVGDLYISGGTSTGMGFGTHTFTSTLTQNFPFVLKTNANGDVIWGTNASTSATTYAYGVCEGAAVAGFAGTITWGAHSLTVAPNSGYDVVMTRFNPNTGEVIALETLEDDPGYADFGTAVTKDLHGNFYVGGKFEHFLYVNSATPMINDGPQTDFFIAKFGSDNCELGIDENVKTGLNAYPNPVQSILNISSQSGAPYKLYNMLGQMIQSGTIDSNSQINLDSQQSGIYILHIGNNSEQQSIKIVKE